MLKIIRAISKMQPYVFFPHVLLLIAAPVIFYLSIGGDICKCGNFFCMEMGIDSKLQNWQSVAQLGVALSLVINTILALREKPISRAIGQVEKMHSRLVDQMRRLNSAPIKKIGVNEDGSEDITRIIKINNVPQPYDNVYDKAIKISIKYTITLKKMRADSDLLNKSENWDIALSLFIAASSFSFLVMFSLYPEFKINLIGVIISSFYAIGPTISAYISLSGQVALIKSQASNISNDQDFANMVDDILSENHL